MNDFTKGNSIVICKGVEGLCIYIGDHRFFGNKPWGGGKIIKRWGIDNDTIDKLIEYLKEMREIKDE